MHLLLKACCVQYIVNVPCLTNAMCSCKVASVSGECGEAVQSASDAAHGRWAKLLGARWVQKVICKQSSPMCIARHHITTLLSMDITLCGLKNENHPLFIHLVKLPRTYLPTWKHTATPLHVTDAWPLTTQLPPCSIPPRIFLEVHQYPRASRCTVQNWLPCTSAPK